MFITRKPADDNVQLKLKVGYGSSLVRQLTTCYKLTTLQQSFPFVQFVISQFFVWWKKDFFASLLEFKGIVADMNPRV